MVGEGKEETRFWIGTFNKNVTLPSKRNWAIEISEPEEESKGSRTMVCQKEEISEQPWAKHFN